MFGHRHAVYAIPTTELVEHLRELIGDRSAVEIGAGNGVLAEALGIPATDNRMQAKAKYRRLYEQAGQPTIAYGRNVIELDAQAAIHRYKPEVVLGCWVTHKYEPRRHAAGGNEIGVDEEDVVARATYVFVGNEGPHAKKPINALPHERSYHPFLFSRAVRGGRDFLAVWPQRSEV